MDDLKDTLEKSMPKAYGKRSEEENMEEVDE